jgi:hypothetical protein
MSTLGCRLLDVDLWHERPKKKRQRQKSIKETETVEQQEQQ